MNNKTTVDAITLSYLRFQTPRENRRNIITFFILFLDFLGIFPLLGDPFSYDFFIAALIPTVLLHIWAIIYIVDPYRFELSYYLFFGIYGIVNTYVLFLVIQKFLYFHLNVESKVPFLLGVLFLIGLLLAVNWINLKALYNGTYHKLQTKKSGNFSWIMAASGLGYVLAQVMLTLIFNNSIKMMIIIIVLSLLSILPAYFSTSIHRYIFIRNNKDDLMKVYPQFALSKGERYKKSKKGGKKR
ncbi:hypothetical protein [Sporosarcina sp. NPDC096371]|uniref:hypothetical protein n=1 Tax=Sporosarcina sp. NPDC096371 TaxID=3364530 RepID=UPI0037FA779C